MQRLEDLHRRQRKSGDDQGSIGTAEFHVAGAALGAPQARFAWQVHHLEDLHRGQPQVQHLEQLHIEVSGSLATTGDALALLSFATGGTWSTSIKVSGSGDDGGRIGAAAFYVAGAALAAPDARLGVLWGFSVSSCH